MIVGQTCQKNPSKQHSLYFQSGARHINRFYTQSRSINVTERHFLNLQPLLHLSPPSCHDPPRFPLHRTSPDKTGTQVLIHAATGGVGLVAVQYAQRLGAEVGQDQFI